MAQVDTDLVRRIQTLSFGLRAGFCRGEAGGEVGGEEIFHRAVVEGDADGAPRGLVAGGVGNVGLSGPFEEVHIRVVYAFAGACFEDGVEGAEVPGG